MLCTKSHNLMSSCITILLSATTIVTAFKPTSRDQLKTAVDAWVTDKDAATVTYGGVIGEWDVSSITDYSGAFAANYPDFNSIIS